MKLTIIGSLFLIFTDALLAGGASAPAVIPQPQKMEARTGFFQVGADTRILAGSDSRGAARFLAEKLRLSTGYPWKVGANYFGVTDAPGNILLTTKNADPHLGPEGYELIVGTNSVVIRAPAQAGMFYGVQTLLQLLPPQIYSTNQVKTVAWRMPCVQIKDWPRFRWRGFMLDVSRHFFNKSEVETILDAMALQKLNVFHWHLTDDQGWRIEIKKYPRLTEVGAWRPGVGFGLDPQSTTAYGPDGRYGGFYTPADIREVVEYAAARHIAVVPEIEMPGHSTAALEAYPQFSCTGGPFTMPLTAGIFNGIYNPANAKTFKFLDGVLTEVFQLFPGKYVHLGGDEVPKETWQNSPDCQALMKQEGFTNEDQLQGWFMRRMEKFVSAHKRTMVGWSEILQGGLPSNAIVMDWIGGAKEAANSGHDVVMSPTAYCYFDFYQSTNRAVEPRAAAWGGPLTLSKVYSYDPMPSNMPPQLQSHILGAQGNLWTEWIPNLKHAEYMIFPRLTALAEVNWSSPSARNFDDFSRRLQVELQRFDELGINYRNPAAAAPPGYSAENQPPKPE